MQLGYVLCIAMHSSACTVHGMLQYVHIDLILFNFMMWQYHKSLMTKHSGCTHLISL